MYMPTVTVAYSSDNFQGGQINQTVFKDGETKKGLKVGMDRIVHTHEQYSCTRELACVRMIFVMTSM